VTVSRSPYAAARWLSYVLNMPARKTFLLDPHGARIWNLCDGKTSVRAIVNQLAMDHGWPEKRAREAVLLYLSTLSHRKLMNFGPVSSESPRE
jgi:hypothetical protein